MHEKSKVTALDRCAPRRLSLLRWSILDDAEEGLRPAADTRSYIYRPHVRSYSSQLHVCYAVRKWH